MTWNPTAPGLPPLTFWGAMRWDVVRTLVPADAGTVVEYGCGMGSFGARLAAHATTYVGGEPAAGQRHDHECDQGPWPRSTATAARRRARGADSHHEAFRSPPADRPSRVGAPGDR